MDGLVIVFKMASLENGANTLLLLAESLLDTGG